MGSHETVPAAELHAFASPEANAARSRRRSVDEPPDKLGEGFLGSSALSPLFQVGGVDEGCERGHRRVFALPEV